MSNLIQRLQTAVAHMAPHQKQREQGKLLIECLAALSLANTVATDIPCECCGGVVAREYSRYCSDACAARMQTLRDDARRVEIVNLDVNRHPTTCRPSLSTMLKSVGLSFILLASGARSMAQSLFALPQPVASIAPAVNPNLGSISLVWTHSKDTNVVGYSIAYGTNRTALNNSAGVGYVTNATITGLMPASTYYFQAFSLNAQGITSEPNNMVTNFIQPRLVMLPDRWKVHISLPAGRTNIVQCCTNGNFSGTIRNLMTNSSGGSIWFYATNDAARNFYRVKPN